MVLSRHWVRRVEQAMIPAEAAKARIIPSFAANDLIAMICHDDNHICSGERRTMVTLVFLSFYRENSTFSKGYSIWYINI